MACLYLLNYALHKSHEEIQQIITDSSDYQWSVMANNRTVGTL